MSPTNRPALPGLGDLAENVASAATVADARLRIQTPAIVPVGPLLTAGSLTADDLRASGTSCLGVDWPRLCHRPGAAAVRAAGGLRGWSGWTGALVAGSSRWALDPALGASRVAEGEARLVSPYDGSALRLTPESAVEAQVSLGLDVVEALDWPDVAARPARRGGPVALRLLWAERSVVARPPGSALLLPLPVDAPPSLWRDLGQLPADGFTLTGLDDRQPAELLSALESRIPALPAGALRVADWRGGAAGLAALFAVGVELVRLPAEAARARERRALVADREELVGDGWRDDSGPVDSGCGCPACSRLSRAYLHHLLDCDELLGYRLLELHNLARLAWVRQSPGVGDARGASVQ